MLLNKDRYSKTTILRKNGVTVHDSEGAEGLLPWGINSSAQLVAALQAKGDRPSPSKPPPAMYGSGYSAVACEDGTYVEAADATAGPYHAPPLNPVFWAICIPGKAAQTREQWLDGPSRQYIHAVASYIVDKWNADGRTWRLEFYSASRLVAGNARIAGHPCGYTSHAQVSLAYGDTNHTDPGVSFPWDVLDSDIMSLVHSTPIPEDDMAKVVKPYDGPDLAHIDLALLDTAAIALTGGIATWIGNLGALEVQQRLGTIPPGAPTPVMRSDIKAYRLVGPPPPAGYGYIVPGRGAGTVRSDFADD